MKFSRNRPGWFGFHGLCPKYGVVNRRIPMRLDPGHNGDWHNLQGILDGIGPKTRLIISSALQILRAFLSAKTTSPALLSGYLPRFQWSWTRRTLNSAIFQILSVRPVGLSALTGR